MRVGVSIYGHGARRTVEVARTAEKLGYDTFWTGDHVVTVSDVGAHPGPRSTSSSGSRATAEPADVWTTLGAVAAVTDRIRLGTAVHLLALRHPLTTARHCASLQELSGGRFLLGVGAGWYEAEFRALQVDFRRRGRLLDEGLAVLQRALSGGEFSHRGDRWEFDDVQVSGVPVDLPVVVGGHSEAALRRAASRGQGWISSGTPEPDEVLRIRDRLAQLRQSAGRTGVFTHYVRVPASRPELVEAYRSEGLEDFVVWADGEEGGLSGDEVTRRLVTYADRFGLS